VVEAQGSAESLDDLSCADGRGLDRPTAADGRSIQEECLDRVIPLGETHLRELIHECVAHLVR
jgi:hypothetical protein